MMTKPPLDKGNIIFGHSIKFNNDALGLVNNLQKNTVMSLRYQY